ncbi:MAG TPA: hypothetical protein VMW63_08210 [Methanoregulaceae archaeon]|nr:hypothetical protein [Methanoregulaceae archaeon]
MHLDELRSILLSERETGRLIQIPHDLFESTREEVDSLSQEVYDSEDPFSDRVRILIERVSSIRETLQDIFRTRSAKILALAQTQEQGQFVNRDELKKMLDEEKEMFDRLVMGIEQCRCRLVDGTVHRHGTGEAEGAVIEEPCAAILEDVQASSTAFVLGRVLQDMEPFMGVDGRIYELHKEDIITLPERNAEVLCERNIVLSLENR